MKNDPPVVYSDLDLSFSDTCNFFLLVIAVLLIFLSAVVSGSEVAFFSLNRKKIDEIKSENPSLAEKFIKLLNNKKRLLSTLLILNNFINISIILTLVRISQKIKFSDVLIFNFFIRGQMVQAFFDLIFTTFIMVLFGEIFPKIQARINPVRFAKFGLPLIKNTQWIFNPFSNVLLYLSDFIDKNLQNKHFLSIHELSDVLTLASEDSGTSEEDQKILKGIVDFGSTFSKQIMTPRVDIFSVSYTTDFPKLLKLVLENGFSRIPIYRGTIDDIIGVVYAKDLLGHLDTLNFNWTSLIREVYFVPENKKLDDLLIEFQKIKKHLAIVVDEYGGVSGLISLEDIIEEIVGDISDEFDDDNLTYTKVNESIYIFDGKTLLKDFYRTTNTDEEVFENHKREADTLAGFIMEISEEFPKKSQKIYFKNFVFQIEKVDRRRLKSIKVSIINNNQSEKT